MGADGARGVMSEEEMPGAIRQMDDPATEIAAMQKLIKGAGFYLYEYGATFLMTGDRVADERRRAAHGPSVRMRVWRAWDALNSEDRDVRFWGVMRFENEGAENEAMGWRHYGFDSPSVPAPRTLKCPAPYEHPAHPRRR